jgi:hypothetical protein
MSPRTLDAVAGTLMDGGKAHDPAELNGHGTRTPCRHGEREVVE